MAMPGSVPRRLRFMRRSLAALTTAARPLKCLAVPRCRSHRSMRTADEWFREYGESHRHDANKLLHWICVPAIVVSGIGFLWMMPFPAILRAGSQWINRSEEHTSELQSHSDLVCRLLLEKKKK